MAQLFPPSANSLAKVSIVAGGAVAAIAVLALINVNRLPAITNQNIAVEQPVQFTHNHHVGNLGIDCRFCHTTVEESHFAGIPPTKTCMGCHSQVWKDASILQPVRDSFRDDRSLEWIRVHDLPEFVYFNHSIHLKKGIGCESCHGRVDQMPLVRKVQSLNMEWCLQCHRDPAQHIRPRDQLFTMGWDPMDPEQLDPPMSQRELGEKLVFEYGVRSMTNCATCHR